MLKSVKIFAQKYGFLLTNAKKRNIKAGFEKSTALSAASLAAYDPPIFTTNTMLKSSAMPEYVRNEAPNVCRASPFENGTV